MSQTFMYRQLLMNLIIMTNKRTLVTVVNLVNLLSK